VKKLFVIFLILFIFCNISSSQFVLQYKFLEANSIRSIIWNTGVFDQDPRTTNTPGFEWPKGSSKFAVFTAGMCLSAKVNGFIRQAMASYKGEYYQGYCNDSIAITNSNFKIYKVNAGDNSSSNPDWANWGLMVPFGAPYYDVNNNGIYEPTIDLAGVRNAASTIFICMTDGFTGTHTVTEGFGGGTLPLYAEVHMTAWAYSQPSYTDMQFIKYVIINKSKKQWANTYFAIVSDPDLGDPNDDYIGCDTANHANLGYCYNGKNNDNEYGTAPPASGIIFLKGITNKSVTPNVNLGLTSFVFFINGALLPNCETSPGYSLEAHNYLKGMKRDSTPFMYPLVNPPTRTKFCYTGDPETNVNWVEIKGSIKNCGGDTTANTLQSTNPFGDRRFVMSSGADNFIFNVGDTQTVYLCQLIARGTSNLNSVTKLKQLAVTAKVFFNSGFTIGVNQISSVIPEKFGLFQNYPNPFNPSTNIKYQITHNEFVILKIFDITGREVESLVNENQSPGTYEISWNASNYPSGVYFYKLQAGDFVETKKMILLK